MKNKKIWIQALIVVVAITVTAIAATIIYPNVAAATGNNGRWRGWFGHFLGSNPIDKQAVLAEELGITVEELQTAQEEARAEAIQKAVENGLITQNEADWMILRGDTKFFGHDDLFRTDHSLGHSHGGNIKYELILAEKLDITVEQLRTAIQNTHIAAIQQVVEDGLVTQEQADEMLAHVQLKTYLKPDTLLARALGISVEEFQTATNEGKSLTALLNELDIDAATARKNMLTAYQQALTTAVDDGVITQEQADDMLSNDPNPFGYNDRRGDRFDDRGKHHHDDHGSSKRGESKKSDDFDYGDRRK